LRAGFFGLKKTAAPGVDGLTWTQYAVTGLRGGYGDMGLRGHDTN
jgi:hypothetical protein